MADTLNPFRLIAKTMHGMEPILCWELEKLGAKNIVSLHRAVSFQGDLELIYKANYRLRTAIRILVEAYDFQAKDEQEMYDKAKAIPWEDHLDVSGTLATEASVSSEHFKHSKYASLKLKDAIVDRFRERTGIRPNVDVEAPDLLLNLYIKDQDCRISMDSSGESLHKRGYRASGHAAPLNEILAAGMVFLSGWTKERPLWDPMCGSGTLALEAAMIASNTPAGILREDYAFMRWKNFDKALWEKVKNEANAEIDKEGISIKGTDLSGIHVRMARSSSETLALDEVMHFERADFFEQKGQGEFLIFNPPYGERMGQTDIIGFYEDMSDHLKHQFPGSECWYISSNEEALKGFSLKPTKRMVLFNGSLECLFQRFDLYDGSRKGMKVERPESYADRFWPAPEARRPFKKNRDEAGRDTRDARRPQQGDRPSREEGRAPRNGDKPSGFKKEFKGKGREEIDSPVSKRRTPFDKDRTPPSERKKSFSNEGTSQSERKKSFPRDKPKADSRKSERPQKARNESMSSKEVSKEDRVKSKPDQAPETKGNSFKESLKKAALKKKQEGDKED